MVMALNVEWATIDEPSRPRRWNSVPSTSPRANSAGNWITWKWARPKASAEDAMAIRVPHSRATTPCRNPRKNSSSTSGAPTTTRTARTAKAIPLRASLASSRAGSDSSFATFGNSRSIGR